MKKAALHNLGCKVNSYETEAMQEILEKNGYEIVPFEEKADIYIINTCSVTNMADRKSRQMLHRARKQNPDAVVVAAGCYVQAAGEELLQDASVDILIGNNEKVNLPDILKTWEEEHVPSHIRDLTHERTYEELSLDRTAEHTRAYVKIQDGCNQFCSYCIIPYTRGRVRSRRLPDILAEVNRLAENGYQEVVLTGIHLDSYGVDLEEETLMTVIRGIAGIEGIKRIRLGSLEPRIMTEEFVRELSEVEKLCPHFHLSLQSGCDETLRRMNRKYDTEEFRACCERLRRFFDHPALTTDVIAGFPGETEEEFAATVDFLQEIGFYEMHVFKYSRRKGTRADRMPDQIPESEKTRRSDILLKMTEENSRVFRERLIGTVVQVLMEESVTIGGQVYQVGHTREYVRVAVPENTSLTNRLVQVKVDKFLEADILGGLLL
ncbi:MAG: tRNA (N(6)-L-threonylcarbamoyladenosine(37)-C(2))-methylthiotransferase MtaB [Clostridiales bacterium]|nr:tRNA (N(6)-L-threonylcarbamoyladenosine(37)-C(2))-methylthiotransferase MtaB [Clostridiales bacterium]